MTLTSPAEHGANRRTRAAFTVTDAQMSAISVFSANLGYDTSVTPFWWIQVAKDFGVVGEDATWADVNGDRAQALVDALCEAFRRRGTPESWIDDMCDLHWFASRVARRAQCLSS